MDTLNIESQSIYVDLAINFNNDFILLSSTRVMTENPPDKEENKWPWTLVESKCAWWCWSFPSYETGRMNTLRGSNLTSEQEAMVHATKWNLTSQEQAKIDHCYENVHIDSDGNDSSRDEGPLKGKGIDPQNWGALEFEPSELNVNAQWEAMSAWNQVRDWDLASKESKFDDEEKGIPRQKGTKYKPQIESVSDNDTLKMSAPAAAMKKTPASKLTPWWIKSQMRLKVINSQPFIKSNTVQTFSQYHRLHLEVI